MFSVTVCNKMTQVLVIMLLVSIPKEKGILIGRLVLMEVKGFCDIENIFPGRWILKPEYLTASDHVKEWLPEEDFEWQPKHGQKSQSDPLVLAPIRWRLQFSLTGEPAFKGWKVSVVVSDNKRGHVYKR